jgi:hypothetical protein
MSRNLLLIAISTATLMLANGAVAAGPPPGVTMGPPAFVTMGPPPGVTMGPPPSVTTGPPPGVTMGPPAAALAHIPNGVPLGQPPGVPVRGNAIGTAVSQAARANAATHSDGVTTDSLDTTDTGGTDTNTGTGTQQANAASELGKLNAAHASSVAFQHANPNSAVGEIATYENQMNAALALTDPTAMDAAITAARQQLASVSNKQLTPDAVTRIDGMLGISGADPTLGTTP